MSARHPVLQELLRTVPPPRTAPKRRARRSRRKASAEPATKKCTFVLPRELAEELRLLCGVQDVTQRTVIEQLVREYVGRHQRLLPD